MTLVLRPIAVVQSPLTDPEQAPRQGDEGAPDAVLVLEAGLRTAFYGLAVGDEIVVLTWLHLARRDLLAVHPRGDAARPVIGVLATRSPDRPNPIGLHRARITAIDDLRITVAGLEAVDGTPVLDIKPVLGAIDDR